MTVNLLKASTYPYYVNGAWLESKSGEKIDIYSPYLEEVMGKIQAITKCEADLAISSARKAQNTGLSCRCNNGPGIYIDGRKSYW